MISPCHMYNRKSTSFIVTVIWVLLHGSTVWCHNAEEKYYSTSVVGMEQLLFTEQHLIDTLEKFTEALHAKVNALKNVVSHLRVENQKALANTAAYLNNPLNGYSLIRRLYNDWPNIEVFMQKPVGESYLKVLETYHPVMPTARDVYEASKAIYRLQMTYDLKASDMAAGILDGKQHSAKLDAIDCFFIGAHLFGEKEYYDAAFWIYNAIQAYGASDYTRIIDFPENKLLALYAETLIKQGRPEDALESITSALELKPEDAGLLKRRNDIEYLAKVNTEPPVQYNTVPPSVYALGCRGGFSEEPNRYHCLYNTTASAFVRLAPFKMEIIQLEPYLVLFHDVISDKEINELKKLATPNLERATVYSDDVDDAAVTNERTSKFSWFTDDVSDTTQRLNQRIMDMTGLEIKGSESLQVMNYGMGGHYDTHWDFFNVSQDAEVVRKEGDRISTVLFYLSNVEQGGATVFPRIRKAVYPRKGSAVVWYNLNNRVEGDALTLHAACPVIVGSKWVCNKWIRAKAQMFRKPCYK